MTTYNYAPFVAVDPNNSANVAIGATGVLYDVSDTNHTTPLQPTDLNGLPIAQLVSNSLGIIQAFQLTVPEAVWVGGGVAVPVYSFKGVLDAVLVTNDSAASAASSAATAANSATAAQAAAEAAATAPTDASVDAAVVRAGAVSNWKPNTAYITGQPTVNPSGDLVVSLTNHTSGASFNSANWSSGSYSRKTGIPLNVKDYGAIGDGTTDDTNAINAALAAVPGGGRAVYMPAGRYKVSAPLTITQDGTTLYGDGAGYKVGGTSPSYATRIEAAAGISNAVILVQRAANDRPLAGVLVRDLSVDGGLLGSAVDGIMFRADEGRIDKVNVWRCSGNGVRVMGYTSPSWETYDTFITNCIIGNNAGNGAVLDTKSSDTHWTNNVFLNNLDNFVILGGASLQMSACHLYGAVKRNIFFNGSGSRAKFSNCKFEGSGQELLLIDTTAGGYSDIQFTGCGFSTLDQAAATNTWDYVKITGPSGNGAGRTQFVGNNFALKGGSSIKARYAINLDTSAAQNTILVGNSFGPASHWGTGAMLNNSFSSLPQYIRGNFGLGDAIAPVTQAATTYTPTLADCDGIIETTSATAVTVTIPTVATAGWAKGNTLTFTQYGAGQITFAGASGVTLRSPRALTTRAIYSTVHLRMRGTNEWVLEGDLT